MLITIDNRTIELSDEQVSAFHALTRLQQGVVLGSLEGLAPADAHRRAGGKCKTESQRPRLASEILTKPDVAKFIDSFKVDKVESLGKVIIDRDAILAMLAEQATCDIKLQDLNKPENFKHISEVTIDATGVVRYKMNGPADRRAAAKQLAEMLGWNKPQQVEVMGSLAVTLTTAQRKVLDKALDDEY